MAKTIILGIDPGTRITGYGIIEASSLEVFDYGCIRPPPKEKLERRYLILYESLEKLIETYHPEAISVETQFIGKNVDSAMKLGMARGMVLLIAAKNQIPLFEYSPTRVKKGAVGTGFASKLQMQKTMQTILSLKEMPTPEDAADALAIALCHANTIKMRNIHV